MTENKTGLGKMVEWLEALEDGTYRRTEAVMIARGLLAEEKAESLLAEERAQKPTAPAGLVESPTAWLKSGNINDQRKFIRNLAMDTWNRQEMWDALKVYEADVSKPVDEQAQSPVEHAAMKLAEERVQKPMAGLDSKAKNIHVNLTFFK